MNQQILSILGLSISTLGSILVGLIGLRGIPKPGDQIRAPRYKTVFFGWLLIIMGFIILIIAEIINYHTSKNI